MSRGIYRVAVPVGRSARSGYEIVIGAGLCGSLAALIERFSPAYRYALITDHHVAELYGARLLRSLHASGHRADVFAFQAGEARKTRATWAAICDAMLETGLGRDTAVIALGGGVASDLGGFVAATYMRGLPVVQVPTSLLAMVDASVGGKTGVNTDGGKNLIGAFWPPRVVVIDPEVLATLPEAHLRSGLAEIVKHGAIADAEQLRTIERQADALIMRDAETLASTIVRSVEIKADFVTRDETELGARKALNFGHTIAHALEKVCGYEILHGEAVAIGMVIEARVGESAGVTEHGTAERLREVLTAIGLPTTCPPQISRAELLDAVRHDKKVRGGRVEYSLLASIGAAAARAGWAFPVADEIVAECLDR